MKTLFFFISLLATISFGVFPVEAGTGVLEVLSDPAGAKVYINEIFVGRTPYRNEEMPLGTHRVRAVLREDLPAATWEGRIDGVGSETIRFDFEKVPAVSSPPAAVDRGAAPKTTAPPPIPGPAVTEEIIPDTPAAPSPKVHKKSAHLSLTGRLVGNPPRVTADRCNLAVKLGLGVPLSHLGAGDFFVGDLAERPSRTGFVFDKPDQELVHTWDESCFEIEYRTVSVFTEIAPGEYILKLNRRLKTRNLKFGVVPDDEILYKLADRETIRLSEGERLSVEITVNLDDGSYEIERKKP